MADKQDIDQKRLDELIETDARLTAEEHKAALEWVGEAIGDPPRKLSQLLKKHGIDPKKPPLGGDRKSRERIEAFMVEARKAFDKEIAAAEGRIVAVYDAPAPLSPTACTKPGKGRSP